MIEVYKILTDKYDSNVNLHLERQKDSITRRHSLKLVHPRYMIFGNIVLQSELFYLWNITSQRMSFQPIL